MLYQMQWWFKQTNTHTYMDRVKRCHLHPSVTSLQNTSEIPYYWIAFQWPSCASKQITQIHINLSNQISNNQVTKWRKISYVSINKRNLLVTDFSYYESCLVHISRVIHILYVVIIPDSIQTINNLWIYLQHDEFRFIGYNGYTCIILRLL